MKKYTKGDTIKWLGVLNKDITGYSLRADIYDVSGNEIQLANSTSGGSDSQIKILTTSSTESTFLITVAKNLTTNFDDNASLEIEIENTDGELKTFSFENRIKFKKEKIIWTEPS